jgi:hypothetical protein
MGDSIQRLAYERTIRNILNFPHQPAVVVYMNMLPGSHFGASVESDMMVIAQHYQLPVLSARWASVACYRHLASTLVPGRTRVLGILQHMLQDGSMYTAGCVCLHHVHRVNCRGAFYELMKKKVRTFRVDGNQGSPAKDAVDDPGAFFFCGDNRHAGPKAYQYLAELAIFLFQHVCSHC